MPIRIVDQHVVVLWLVTHALAPIPLGEAAGHEDVARDVNVGDRPRMGLHAVFRAEGVWVTQDDFARRRRAAEHPRAAHDRHGRFNHGLAQHRIARNVIQC